MNVLALYEIWGYFCGTKIPVLLCVMPFGSVGTNVKIFGRNMLLNAWLFFSKMETTVSDKPLCVMYQKNVTFKYVKYLQEQGQVAALFNKLSRTISRVRWLNRE
jgi:hypothetical protein